jgi:hypothetical protein
LFGGSSCSRSGSGKPANRPALSLHHKNLSQNNISAFRQGCFLVLMHGSSVGGARPTYSELSKGVGGAFGRQSLFNTATCQELLDCNHSKASS